MMVIGMNTVLRLGASIAICLITSVGVVSGQNTAPSNQESTVPALGDKARDFTLNDLQGRPVGLFELTGKSKVVLIVLRGFPGYQCPICSSQVGSLISKATELSDAGAQVVFVYPGPPDKLNDRAGEFLKGKKLPDNFLLVVDRRLITSQASALHNRPAGISDLPRSFYGSQRLDYVVAVSAGVARLREPGPEIGALAGFDGFSADSVVAARSRRR